MRRKSPPRARLRVLLAVATAVLSGRPLVGVAQAPAQVPPTQPPLFRSNAELVEVDVTVQDKSGRFVADLTVNDFDVREDGKSQPIELVYLVGGVSEPRTAAEPARPDSAVSLRGAPGRPMPRVFVVIFDDEHLTPGGFKRVQAAAESLFDAQFKPGDIGGVVADAKMANGRLTSDRRELLAAVRAAKPSAKANARRFDERQWPRMSAIEAVRIAVNRDDTVLNEVVARACADDPSYCQRGDPRPLIMSKASTFTTETQAATNATLQRLAAVLNGLTRLEGRKTVLLLSEGFIAEEAWPLVEQNLGLASRANARIYTLDARGLDRGQSDRLAGSDPGGLDAGARLLAQLDFGADSVNSLAVDTGGFVVRNTNVFDQAIAQIAADAGTYYVLDYRPEKMADGKFRKISVTVKQPGVVVRARRGYLATPRPAATTTESAPRSADSPGTATGETPAPARPGAVTDAPTAVRNTETRKNAVENVEALVNKETARSAATTGAVAASPAHGADRDASAGWAAYQRGDLETARQSLSKAALSETSRPWVHYALGQADYAVRDFPGAIASWERVRASTPEFLPVYFDLVDGYLQTRDYDKAVRVLRNAAERWPTDHEVFSALGVVQVARGALDDAVKSLEQAIALAPQEAVGYFNLAKALELRYRKTRRYVQQTRMWVANETDRTNAIADYQRYLEVGGPFDASARDGLARLGWK